MCFWLSLLSTVYIQHTLTGYLILALSLSLFYNSINTSVLWIAFWTSYNICLVPILNELNNIFNIRSFLYLYENHDFTSSWKLSFNTFCFPLAYLHLHNIFKSVITEMRVEGKTCVLLSMVLHSHYEPEYLGSLVTFDQLLLMLMVSSLTLLIFF